MNKSSWLDRPVIDSIKTFWSAEYKTADEVPNWVAFVAGPVTLIGITIVAFIITGIFILLMSSIAWAATGTFDLQFGTLIQSDALLRFGFLYLIALFVASVVTRCNKNWLVSK